jgi:hypothetical protein
MHFIYFLSPNNIWHQGGVNFQNLNGKNEDGSKLTTKLKTGVNIGVTADIPVAAPDYFVQSGLLFSSKGAKIEETDNKSKC